MSSSDVSSATKFFPTANEGFTTTTSGSVASGASSVGLSSVSGLTNATVFVGIIEPGTSKEQTFTGTVDTGGSQITGVVWTRGTNVDHASGVTIVDYVTGTAINLMTKGLLVSHGQDGTPKAGITYPASTYTTPTIASFVNATHNHQNATGGGTLAAAAVPNLALNTQALSNPYKFGVYLNSAQSSTNGISKILFDTELFDTNSNFDSATNHRYVAPVDGFYQFNWSVTAVGVTTSTWVSHLYKNGVTTKDGSYAGSATSFARSAGSAFVQLAATDYVEIFIEAGGANPINNVASTTRFEGFLVSQT